MSHQDWKEVTFKKDLSKDKQHISQQQRRGNTVSKKKMQGSEDAAKMRSLENETETFKLKKIDAKLSKQIQQARCGLGLSQKDLANKVNLPVKTIVEYENGKAIPDNKVLNKLKRTLKITKAK